MKNITLLFAGVLLSLSIFGQTKKITIYCELEINGNTEYYKSLEKILPDSLKAAILINPRRDYSLRNFNDALLFMSANGWKLVSFDFARIVGLLSKEIVLNEAAWELYTDKLKNLHSKAKP